MIRRMVCEYCGVAHDIRALCQPRQHLSRRAFFFLSAKVAAVAALAPMALAHVAPTANVLLVPSSVAWISGLAITNLGHEPATVSTDFAHFHVGARESVYFEGPFPEKRVQSWKSENKNIVIQTVGYR